MFNTFSPPNVFCHFRWWCLALIQRIEGGGRWVTLCALSWSSSPVFWSTPFVKPNTGHPIICWSNSNLIQPISSAKESSRSLIFPQSCSVKRALSWKTCPIVRPDSRIHCLILTGRSSISVSSQYHSLFLLSLNPSSIFPLLGDTQSSCVSIILH